MPYPSWDGSATVAPRVGVLSPAGEAVLLSLDAFAEGVPKSFLRFMGGPRDGVPETSPSRL
jgi:hypothetical protein